MDSFENKLVKGVHASRYIASWVKSGGDVRDREAFGEWLSLEGLNAEEIMHLDKLARNGRLELEISATRFLKNYKESK